MAQMSGEDAFLEVGAYRGGGALHILNAIGSRPQPFWCFDPFEGGGFEEITANDNYFRRPISPIPVTK